MGCGVFRKSERLVYLYSHTGDLIHTTSQNAEVFYRAKVISECIYQLRVIHHRIHSITICSVCTTTPSSTKLNT